MNGIISAIKERLSRPKTQSTETEQRILATFDKLGMPRYLRKDLSRNMEANIRHVPSESTGTERALMKIGMADTFTCAVMEEGTLAQIAINYPRHCKDRNDFLDTAALEKELAKVQLSMQAPVKNPVELCSIDKININSEMD